ncbi:MAG: hypothetical protein RLZZ401_658, partial [Pseudomonadota bacterium]
ENFPVASVLCPPRLRPPIQAIYHFARTADDLADEGNASATDRLADLAAFRADLIAVTSGASPSPRWSPVFNTLADQIRRFNLPLPLLHDLLNAFEQDVHYTAGGLRYADTAELLAYCQLSANPIGRLLLHLYQVTDAQALTQSDDICSALQLINFWQDLSVDTPRARHYLPQDACARHGVTDAMLTTRDRTPNTSSLIAEQVQLARCMMQKGAPLAMKLPGRAGWEMRLVVAGGLRILDKITASGFATLQVRPRLSGWDLAPMLWHAVRLPLSAD